MNTRSPLADGEGGQIEYNLVTRPGKGQIADLNHGIFHGVTSSVCWRRGVSSAAVWPLGRMPCTLSFSRLG